MDASELYKAGRLREAIEAQSREVKAHPSDPSLRLFLFELLTFAGDLDRARRQADAIRYDDPVLDVAILVYRSLVDNDQARRRLLGEGVSPEFFSEPPEHLRLRLEAVNRLREKRPAEAAEALARAAGATPEVHGRLNGQPFQSLRDADDLFAGVLEVFAQGRYHWVPLEQINLLTMDPPKSPRDLLYIPARLEIDLGTCDVFLPALYPGSHEHPDDQVKLGRMTDWTIPGDGPVLGIGQHLYLRDEDEIGLLEWRELRIDR